MINKWIPMSYYGWNYIDLRAEMNILGSSTIFRNITKNTESAYIHVRFDLLYSLQVEMHQLSGDNEFVDLP